MEKSMENEVVLSALVVDDQALLRHLHQRLLATKGFQTKCVENGQEAIDVFKSGASFNLVLTDLEMPIMDGIETTKQLRSMNVKSKIVGITSCAEENKVDEFVKAGLDYCLKKPLNIEMVNAIMKLMNE